MMRSLSIDIPGHWTDEEALTVFEFIDGIRDQIWDHYCLQIQEAAKTTRHVHITLEDPITDDEEQVDFFDDQILF